jgi:hypothetical protein
LISYDGPDGMGYEGVHIQMNFTVRGRELHELENDAARIDAVIDDAMLRIPQVRSGS